MDDCDARGESLRGKEATARGARSVATSGARGRLRVCGLPVYFENRFGEQLVFVHDDGEPDATVLLGDVGWEPRRVSDAGGLPDAGDLILNEEEGAFVSAC